MNVMKRKSSDVQTVLRNNINKDKLCIVQFPHPGQEYPVCGTNAKLSNGVYEVDWSEMDSHYRRLIMHKGSYVDANWKFHDGVELVFWNEWEGPTTARDIKDQKNRISASFLHTVRYPKVSNASIYRGLCGASNCCFGRYGNLMNTDPCVFGTSFKYSICRQTPKGIMRRLAPGSLIIFGSRINCEFYLDTVFMVGDIAIDYRTGNDLKAMCSKEYKNLTVDRLPAGNYTFYRGITPNGEKLLQEQCFSFVPARLSSMNSRSERCKVDLVQLNSIAQMKAFNVDVWRNKKASSASAAQIISVWNEVVRQVTEQKFVLGVRFAWPKK